MVELICTTVVVVLVCIHGHDLYSRVVRIYRVKLPILLVVS